DINVITKDIQQSFEQTNEQVDLLKATVKKVEQQLAAKESDLRASKEDVLSLKNELESKEANLKKLFQEHEIISTQLGESCNANAVLSEENFLLKEQARVAAADIQQMKSRIESAESIISNLKSEHAQSQEKFLLEKEKFEHRLNALK